MQNLNYQPGAWPGDDGWSQLSNPSDENDWDHAARRYRSPQTSQTSQTSQFVKPNGSRCYVVCEPTQRPLSLERIANSLLSRNIIDARRIYPNIREVVRNGKPLAVSQDYKPDRINVETRNGIITRIVWYY
ncbi:MAG: hypothetical protein Satyrvirus4_3 [Satyrvirus sp.]|uniref:Uncharacterized protein n=1 Tax=Satyrvirus sp. TaxID=2487771 RepID=A0A3G5AD22_9VIRU|nr:MAG: hypothetical protein Satyrvirus4_3 [Satyrvirus sp.]